MDSVDGRQFHTQSNLHACWHDRSRIGRSRADSAKVLIDQVVKFGSSALESCCVHVRKVVRHNLYVALLCEHTRCCYIE